MTAIRLFCSRKMTEIRLFCSKEVAVIRLCDKEVTVHGKEVLRLGCLGRKGSHCYYVVWGDDGNDCDRLFLQGREVTVIRFYIGDRKVTVMRSLW